MDLTTRYTLQRNTASIMKIWYDEQEKFTFKKYDSVRDRVFVSCIHPVLQLGPETGNAVRSLHCGVMDLASPHVRVSVI